MIDYHYANNLRMIKEWPNKDMGLDVLKLFIFLAQS